MIETRIVPLLALALVLALAACGDDDNGGDTTVVQEETTTTETGAEPQANAPAPSGEAVRSGKVAMVDYAFEPRTVTIQAGGKVTWKNEGGEPHTATADDGSFDTGTVQQGKLESESESFKNTGTFNYICEIHPEMKGTVKVVD